MVISKAQNIIINGGFETQITCPTNGDINYASPWSAASALPPKLFDSCVNSTTLYFGVPVNADSSLGYQVPRNGHAYSGFNAYLSSNSNLREYLKYEFPNPLISHKKYCLTFFVNLLNGSRYAIDAVGAFFSDSSYYCPTIPCLLNCTPQVVNPLGNLLNDTLGWTKISGCFVAGENIKYMTIGNFTNDSLVNKDTNRYVSSWDWATFYYIDDVSLELDTLLSFPEIATIDKDVKLLPNPCSDFTKLVVRTNLASFKLFDLLGNIVLDKKNITDNFLLDIISLPIGVYAYAALSMEGKVFNGKMIKVE